MGSDIMYHSVSLTHQTTAKSHIISCLRQSCTLLCSVKKVMHTLRSNVRMEKDKRNE
jgi:hypothetical protein